MCSPLLVLLRICCCSWCEAVEMLKVKCVHWCGVLCAACVCADGFVSCLTLLMSMEMVRCHWRRFQRCFMGSTSTPPTRVWRRGFRWTELWTKWQQRLGTVLKYGTFNLLFLHDAVYTSTFPFLDLKSPTLAYGMYVCAHHCVRHKGKHLSVLRVTHSTNELVNMHIFWSNFDIFIGACQ